ncbi:DNA-directed DNA polymerase [Powellomyces hirtus]|uniref:DNA-directed DNA polymerase n=1 Tax=Powellomyces hirtus TaxID=109895 RepID=A0A507DMP0_9FUNG|nr:DNA-directed DNA polymerase [Powellomyces hirtus]
MQNQTDCGPQEGHQALGQLLDAAAQCRAVAARTTAATLETWHRHLGHLNCFSVQLMARKGLVEGMEAVGVQATAPCSTCALGKATKLPFPKERSSRVSEVLELLHSDVCKPMRTLTIGGARYFVLFIDNKNRAAFPYLLKTKAETLPSFKIFAAAPATETSLDIRHQLSSVATPQQNGVAEHMNRTLVEMARCLLLQAGLPYKFWGEVFEKPRSHLSSPQQGHTMADLDRQSSKHSAPLHLWVDSPCFHSQEEPAQAWSKCNQMHLAGLQPDYKGLSTLGRGCWRAEMFSLMRSPLLEILASQILLPRLPLTWQMRFQMRKDASEQGDRLDGGSEQGEDFEDAQEHQPSPVGAIPSTPKKPKASELPEPSSIRFRRPAGWGLKAALKAPDARQWKQAARTELDGLHANHTWGLVPLACML